MSFFLLVSCFSLISVTKVKYVPSFFPGAGFKRKAKVWHQLASDMVEKPFAIVKRKIAEGSARPSFVANCFQRSGDQIWSDIPERVIQDTAGAMYTGGRVILKFVDYSIDSILKPPPILYVDFIGSPICAIFTVAFIDGIGAWNFCPGNAFKS